MMFKDDNETNNTSGDSCEDLELAAPPCPDSPRQKSINKEKGPVLRWSNVNMTLAVNNSNKNKRPESKATAAGGGHGNKNTTKTVVLENAWGQALPGEVTAIMGASGSGKTSLLNVIAGRIRPSKTTWVSGDLGYGGASKEAFAFVAQEDVLDEHSTVREAVSFSARLRLPRETTDAQVRERVQMTLEELGLEKVADSLVGGELRRGVSGGEKRRTSVAVELVAGTPSAILLDEPTSGLDSFSAARLVDILRGLARRGNATVLFTVHQPSSRMYQSFDAVVLLQGGRTMYSGRAAMAESDFAKRGYPLPHGYNAAEWMLSVSEENSAEELKVAGFLGQPEEPSSGWGDGTVAQPVLPEEEEEERIDVKPQKNASVAVPQTSVLTQFLMLAERVFTDARRYPLPYLFTAGSMIVLTVFVSLLVIGIGAEDRAATTGVPQAVNASLVNTYMLAMLSISGLVLFVFVFERKLLLREFRTRHYHLAPYMLAHFLLELAQVTSLIFVLTLITYFMVQYRMSFGVYFALSLLLSMTTNAMASLIGCAVSDVSLAQGLMPLALLPQFYYSGVIVPTSLIPVSFSCGTPVFFSTKDEWHSHIAFSFFMFPPIAVLDPVAAVHDAPHVRFQAVTHV